MKHALAILLSIASLSAAGNEVTLSDWIQSDRSTAAPFFEIRGTNDRQNPLRRKLSAPYSGDTLFVQFRLRYAADSIDSASDDDGEFFVLWLDESEGNNASTHSNKIPNVGLHVDADQANRFMVRYISGNEAFGPELKGDREFTLLARLSKSQGGADQPFDQLELWVDPKHEELGKPDAITRHPEAPSRISWMGFSTGRKTEPEDSILIGDLRLSTEHPDAPLPPAPLVKELEHIPAPPAYTPPKPPASIAKVDPQPASIESDHWAFQPIRRPELPKAGNENTIDVFVRAQQEAAGLSPAAPADEATLRRRISLVLTGLPPRDDDPTDPDALIESLLHSPAYGERWGRHWLDVARWAESNGHQHNRDRPHAWRYRDWVVNSFVEDKPFDAFLREQIAGDEITPFDPNNIIATGFLAAARYSGNELDKDIQRNDILVDITNATSKAFLGLTMECAQCHDHFFDPVTQWDYYNLMAFFAKGQPGDVILSESDEKVSQLVTDRWGLFESVRDRLIAKKRATGTPEPVLVIPKSVPPKMTPEEKRTYSRIQGGLSDYPTTWAFYSPVTSPHDLEYSPTAMRWPLPFQKESLEYVQVRYLDRGEVTAPGPIAEPAWPLLFSSSPERIDPSQPRLSLANWMTGPSNPLTARVWVNRIWQWHFGRGLVSTSGDFGPAGSSPSHPELLDWLASELIDSGWSTSHIHRLILSSNTFRQGSEFSAANANLDPDNQLLWRWLPRRLEAEAIRDSILTVTGSLDTTRGGPSVALTEVDDSFRRSLYLKQRRDNLPHQQQLFDGANAVTSCAKRRTSTVSLQPLWLMNSHFVQTQSAILASHIASQASPEDNARTSARRLIETILSREATPDEISELADLIESTGLEAAATVMLNTNEFLYIP